MGGIIQRTSVQVGLLAAAVLLVYSASLQNAYVWLDDTNYVIDNPLVTNFAPDDTPALFQSVRGNFTPLTWLSHILAFRMFGENPFGHHLFNLLLHMANVLLLYSLVRKLTEPDRFGLFTAGGSALAFITALLFAVHPQNVEAVAWIAARKDLLMCFFALGAAAAYLRFIQTRSRLAYLAAFMLFAGASLAKPTAVMIAPVFALLDIRAARNPASESLHYRAAIFRLLPFAVLGCLIVWWAWAAQLAAGAIEPNGQFTVMERLIIVLQNIWGYFSRYFLLGDYFVNYEVHKNFSWRVPASLGILTAVAGALLLPRSRPWALLWCAGLVMLAPGLGFVQYGVQSGADRFAYLAFIPIHLWVAGLVILVCQRVQNRRQRVLIQALMAAIFLLTAGRAFMQTLVWRNDLSLWAHAATVAPDNPLAWQYLGFAFMRHGDYPRAYESLAKSLEELGDGAFIDIRSLYFGLGVTSYETDRREAARDWLNRLLEEGVEGFDKAAYAYYYMARLELDAQHLARARNYVQASLAIMPGYRRALELQEELDAIAVPGAGS